MGIPQSKARTRPDAGFLRGVALASHRCSGARGILKSAGVRSPQREMAINRAATVWCHPRCKSQFPREETRVTDGEYQLGASARVALVSLTLSASFGLTGCITIDDLKVSILNWFDTVNSTRDGEEPLAYAAEPRLIPPAEIPKRAAKAPRKMIKAVRHKPQRPPIVVLPQEKAPTSAPEMPPSGETEGRAARALSMRSRTPYLEDPPSFDERFCAECWGMPAKAE
jgi:hypothetical protein